MTGKRFAALIVAVLLPACASAPADIGDLTPYINPELGFRVDRPSNWEPAVDPANLVGTQPDAVHAVAFASQAASAIFVVYVQDAGGGETLDDYAAQQMNNIRSTAGGTSFSDPVSALLGGLEARLTQATVEQAGQRLTQRTWLAIHAGRGYAVSLVSPDDSDLRAALDAMQASFRFLP